MKTVICTNLRKGLASANDQVNEDSAPLLITRQKGTSAVLMSHRDYQSIEETLYLMQSPGNAARLNEAIESLRNGEGVVRTLDE